MTWARGWRPRPRSEVLARPPARSPARCLMLDHLMSGMIGSRVTIIIIIKRLGAHHHNGDCRHEFHNSRRLSGAGATSA